MLTKKQGDVYVDELLGKEPSPLPDGAVSFFPHAAIETIEFSVDSIKIEKIDNIYVIVSAVVKENTRYKNGEYLEETAKCTRNNITFKPDFEKLQAFELKIPNGTPVIFSDERGYSGVEYEWLNGKSCVKIDDGFIESLNTEVKKIKNKLDLPAIEEDKTIKSCNLTTQNNVKNNSEKIQQKADAKSFFNGSFLVFIPVAIILIAGSIIAYFSYRRRI